ncbi:MAG: MFS transporter [Methylobacteriaceae bacterium]|nr:MFS transporter [Methylobacteriaceae bacterium]
MARLSSRPGSRGAPGVSAGPPSRAAVLGWILFDPACQPFFTLVTTFVFAPYATAILASDPVRGQALWGYATAAAGLALAVLSPVLGSVADAGGRMKPWIAGALAVMAAASAGLWWAAPGAPSALLLALGLYAVGTVAAEIAAVFNNAMMGRLAGPDRMGRLSGYGWGAGYAGGLVSLAIVLGFLAASPETGRTLAGLPPLFGLDPARHEGDRIVGPLSALWMVLLAWPLFLWTPDGARSGRPWREAVGTGLRGLRRTIGEARGKPALARFLLANMVYQDGLVALFAFGGVYGAGILGWGAIALGVFGILLTVAGTLGAILGGILEDRTGPRPVILGSLAVLTLVCVAILSIGREHVLFVVPVAPPEPRRLFGSWPERLFLVCGCLIGAVAGPLQASSRALLARSVPPAEAGRYFGLLSLSGKLTSFLAPLAVAVATELTGRQSAAPLVLIAFFAAGAALMPRRDPEAASG